MTRPYYPSIAPQTNTGAIFSHDRAYRYLLWRRVNLANHLRCLFIMLNPSVANESQLDHTVTKCVHWAFDWGFGWLEVVNLFAYVSTDSTPIRKAQSGIAGLENNDYIREAIRRADRIVVAYGAHGIVMKQGDAILEMLDEMAVPALCFGVTKKDRQPLHPLMLAYDTELLTVRAARAA